MFALLLFEFSFTSVCDMINYNNKHPEAFMTFFDDLLKNFPNLKVLEREPMANHTSFRIGGPAWIAFPDSCDNQFLTEGIECNKVIC